MISEDHPGFFDLEYKKRRNFIAEASDTYAKEKRIENIPYSFLENTLWKKVKSDLEEIHQDKAVSAYLDQYEEFKIANEVMQLTEINEKLKNNYFNFIPASGLYPPVEYFRNLSNRLFTSTQYIRHHSVPDYTPEPDIIHEVFGHAVLFLDMRYCNLNQLFGEVAMYASVGEIEELINLYWYALEFGLCYENKKIKAFGSGLLSSVGELSRINEVPIKPFDIEEMKKTSFSTQSIQPVLFCAESYESAISKLEIYLKERLEKLCQLQIFT